MQSANSNRLLTVLTILCLVPGVVFGATHKKKHLHQSASGHPATGAAVKKTVASTASAGHASRMSASAHVPVTHTAKLRASRRVWLDAGAVTSSDGRFREDVALAAEPLAAEPLVAEPHVAEPLAARVGA